MTQITPARSAAPSVIGDNLHTCTPETTKYKRCRECAHDSLPKAKKCELCGASLKGVKPT